MYCGLMVQDMPMMCIEVDYKCGVDVSICTIFDPYLHTKVTNYPQNELSNSDSLSCHQNSGQTMVDRAKICIVGRCVVMIELVIATTFQVPRRMYYHEWDAAQEC